MTINGSCFAPTEIMSEKDTMEAIRYGCSKFAFSMRKVAKQFDDPSWIYYAETAECLKDAGMYLNNMKSMSRLETAMAISLKQNPKGFLNGN